MIIYNFYYYFLIFKLYSQYKIKQKDNQLAHITQFQILFLIILIYFLDLIHKLDSNS